MNLVKELRNAVEAFVKHADTRNLKEREAVEFLQQGEAGANKVYFKLAKLVGFSGAAPNDSLKTHICRRPLFELIETSRVTLGT